MTPRVWTIKGRGGSADVVSGPRLHWADEVRVVEESRLRGVEEALRMSNGALMFLCEVAEQARGHYGIEECAGPLQPETEWDEIQDCLAQAARDGREIIEANRAALASPSSPAPEGGP